MKSFEWASPTTIDEAVKLLTAADNADPADYDESPRPLAGGQDLLTTMKDRIIRPPRVVNLKQIPNLSYIKTDPDGSLRLGALTTLTEIEESDEIKKNFPGLADAAESVASPQIRNLATVAGNLCQRPRCWYYRLESVVCLKKGGEKCYSKNGENKYNAILGGGPSYIVHPSDMAPMLLALNATLKITGPDGPRDLPLKKFFTTPKDGNLQRENVLKDNELITEIVVPPSPMNARSTYLKFKERTSLDFAMSAVAAAVELNPDKTVKQVSVILGGVAPIPWHVPKAEAALVGKALDEKNVSAAAVIALSNAQPLSKNAYKVPLTQTLIRRALLKLATA